MRIAGREFVWPSERSCLISRLPPPKCDAGWGYADWHWNCEVIAAGGAHHVVPGTLFILFGATLPARIILRIKRIARNQRR